MHVLHIEAKHMYEKNMRLKASVYGFIRKIFMKQILKFYSSFPAQKAFCFFLNVSIEKIGIK